MYVRHVELEGPGPPIPAWQVSPDVAPAAGAALFHSYGSCKEAMLGLALTLAGAGLVCTVPDLPGHGEHPEVFGPSVLDEARAAVQHARSYGSAVAVGHSLGGRLALLSGADAVLVVLGEEDIPGIRSACADLVSSLAEAELVNVAEGMVLEADEPPDGFGSYLKHWVNHGGLMDNRAVAMEVVAFTEKVLRNPRRNEA